MTKMLRALLLATCSIAVSSLPALAQHKHAHHRAVTRGVSTIALFGDAPYGTTPTDNAEFLATPAFVQSVNADPDVSLVMHVGDIHSGKQYCTNRYDHGVRELWNKFADPMIYTPGDNEWTDCHKTTEGGGTYNAGTGQVDFLKDPDGKLIDYAGGNPISNLGLVRSIFFNHPGRTIGGKRVVTTQAQAFDPSSPSDSEFVENVTFRQSGVRFVTLNIPGGSNNDADIWYGAPTMSDQQSHEISVRNAATMHWLDAAFDKAEAEHAKAVLIFVQADMWDASDNIAHLANFDPLLTEIAARTTAFGKPVLLVNGDSHVYRSDNPMKQGAPCVLDPGSGQVAAPCPTDVWVHHPDLDVANFHRIVVHGSTTPLEWLKMTIDPKKHADGSTDGAFGPFAWARQIQN